MPRNSGFIVPLVSIFVIIFVVMPVAYWYLLAKPNTTGSVKGSANIAAINGDSNVLQIKSSLGTWDLFIYQCQTLEECKSNLTSGKKVTIVSGGKTQSQPVVISKKQEWSPDNYIKIYVKSGWGSTNRLFQINSSDSASENKNVNIIKDGYSYDVLLLPVKSLDKLNSYSFRDN